MGKNIALAILLAVCLALLHGNRALKKDFHQRYLNGVEYSAEYGCYFESQNLCGKIKDDIERGACYDDALVKCPAQAKKFRRWIETGGRG